MNKETIKNDNLFFANPVLNKFKRDAEELSDKLILDATNKTDDVGLLIMTDYAGMNNQLQYVKLHADFIKMVNDDTIKNIVLYIDSTGGEVNGCRSLAYAIYDARDIKPITAVLGSHCCSAAYYIASAAGKIVAEKSTLVGSIGVITYYQGNEELEAITYRGKYSKNKNNNIEEELQKRLDIANQDFLDDIALFRNFDFDVTLEKTEEGKTFSAEEALEKDLVDLVVNNGIIYIGKFTNFNNNKMNKDLDNKKLIEDALQAERQRCAAIMQASSSQNLATLLLNTSLSQDECVALASEFKAQLEASKAKAQAEVKTELQKKSTHEPVETKKTQTNINDIMALLKANNANVEQLAVPNDSIELNHEALEKEKWQDDINKAMFKMSTTLRR